MNRDALRDAYRQLMRHLYAPGPDDRRIRTFLREYQPPRFSGAPTPENIGAFARASVRLGVLGRERFRFWGLLMWTSFRRPTLVPVAIRLAIDGFHFRKCSAALGA